MNDSRPLTSPALSLLPAHYFLAIEMKYEGNEYADIAGKIHEMYKTDVAVTTIKWWFSKTGPLKHHYDDYASMMNEARIEDSHNLWKAHIKKAQAALMKEISRGGMTAVMAAKEWIARAEGNVPQKFEGKMIIATLADLMKEAVKEPQHDGSTTDREDNPPSIPQ